MLFTVQAFAVRADHLEQLRALFTHEWGAVDAFHGVVRGQPIPGPLAALGDDGALVGGLAFTVYPHPATAVPSLWINALLVISAQRRKGIASRLIQAAERSAQGHGFASLHVSTRVPGLYQRLGWHMAPAEASREHTVLTRTL